MKLERKELDEDIKAESYWACFDSLLFRQD